MKLPIFLLFVMAFCVSFSSAEIEARFPGFQPVLVPGAPGSSLSANPGGVLFEDKMVLDSFNVTTSPPVVVVLEVDVPPLISSYGYDYGDSILGFERDIQLTATNGEDGLLFSAGANQGSFNVASPPNAEGYVLIQYDGVDSSSALDTAVGLNGFDVTHRSALGFRILARVDVETEVEIRAVDSEGRSGVARVVILPGTVSRYYYFSFANSFDNFVDFTSLNAIQIQIEADENVDILIDSFTTYGEVRSNANCIIGSVLPCETNYYRLETFNNVQVGDYISITFDQTNIDDDDEVSSNGDLYILGSRFDNLQRELANNNIIRATLGELPGPSYYNYTCDTDCDVEIVWAQLQNATYYYAVSGRGDEAFEYAICTYYRSVDVYTLYNGVPQTVFYDQRPTYPPSDNVLNYRYYVLDVPEQNFSENTYLVVNISRVQTSSTPLVVRLMHESLPIDELDTGIIGAGYDRNSSNFLMDDLVYDYCVDMAYENRTLYDRPVVTDPRMPCECVAEPLLFGAGPTFQLTCQLVVDPCQFKYGRWYISVELPRRSEPYNVLDLTGRANYTLTATTVSPPITVLERNVTVKSWVRPEALTHFRVDVPASSMVRGESHLLVHLSNVRNGIVDVSVHQGLGVGANVAGFESCSPVNATCRTGDACNVVIEKCHFSAGSWYVSVRIARDENETALINDIERLPITYTLRADWMEDPEPERLHAGIPVSKYVGEGLYDFYVVDVPPTIDTWLFIELYAKANDTEVILSVLHGELPGGECYARPDFYCLTGDPRGLRINSGVDTFLTNEAIQRESCTYMIQTCELTPGPLYISVYGHHIGYPAYGDNTYYQVPVHYTLWADFDVALSLQNGVSYSETVYENHYQHYYIRADRILQGSFMTVEITNIRHGIPQSLEGYVNYNYLAGECPCYDNLYNCTGNLPCRTGSEMGALPDLDSVDSCCTMVVPASDFRPGVWYVAVKGTNEDYFDHTTAIGYTLTVTVHDAPQFTPLILGQPHAGEVPQWNKTLEYANFRLGAEPIPLNDLVFKVTFVQNCEWAGKHDDTHDSIWMYVNRGAPATHYLGGYEHKCQVNTTTQSYCTIVVPHCEWEGDDWFVAIQGQYDADFIGRFTLRASLDPIRDHQLTSGVSYYGRVEEQRYDHYFIDVAADEDQYLDLVLYTNQDQDRVTAFLQKDRRAGDVPCFDHIMACENQNYCTAQIHACDLKPGRYYFGVYGHAGQFYDTSVEYTITATMKSVTTTLYNGDPFTGHLRMVGDVQHYRFNVPENVAPGSNLIFEVDNVKNGAVTAYVQKGFLAGRCPCFIWEYTCTASMNTFGDVDQEWCQIQVPTCELEAGEYFFSVWAVEQQSPDSNICNTPVGYTLEVNLFAPEIIDPFVAIRRDPSNTEAFELIANNHYNHYEFSIDDDDIDSGYHVIVEITAVQDGALYVYYNQITPADQNDECHIAELCTGGLGAGTECYWQIPYCLTKVLPGENDKHYITVQGRSGRIQGSYNILIWKQAVPSLIQNDAFTLDTGRVEAPFNAELDIVHDKFHEPHGWTQFVRLENVPARLDMARGQMLEVFFYRITNNVGEPMSFNVYLHPNEPAGAHECCGTDPAEVGMCQGAPCSHTADTTTSVNNGPDQFTHTCSLGNGYGTDGQDDVLFGERCVVRVWPCEFNKYCANQTTDWFMSVVPLSPTDPVTEGPGLQYSVQWRVRDIRRMEGGAVGSIPLNYAVNTYNYSETYSIISETTESQGWLSFYVDFADRSNARLSIQTDFVVGNGTVYIQGDEFASDTVACHEYICDSTQDCTTVFNRFTSNECFSGKYSRYYITVRNTGPVGSNLLVRFRVVDIQQPEVIDIPSHPTQARPYTATSGFSVYPDVQGVEAEAYDYYMLIVDDDDIDRHQSWIVDVTRPEGDVGSLVAYIRYEGLPGESPVGEYGCQAFQYKCEMESADDRCLFQIPHCDLIEGHWYISVHNPDFNVEEGVPARLPRYSLTTYISNPPNHIPLGQQLTVPSVVDHDILHHFSFNVSVADLDFIDRESQINFWAQYLRFQLDGLTGSVVVYLNYGDLAGPDSGPCYDSVDTIECSANSACYLDVVPCDGLRTGTYYLSVQHNGVATYRVSAVLRSNLYFPLALSQSVTGEGQRRGVVDRLYTRTVTQTELNARGDGNNNYRYLVDIATEDDDDLIDTEYLTFTFSTSSLTGNSETVNYEVFRDDCTRFNCQTEGPSSSCTIDAGTLAPCSAKGGRYYIRVENPFQVRFTINVAYNETRVQHLTDRATITEVVYPYEYQEYRFRPANVSEGATLSVQVCAICGDVQAFIRPDSPAGPSPDNSGNPSSCHIDSCEVFGPDDTTFELSNNCCTLFLDTCIFETRDYYIGVRGVRTTYPARNADLSLPARYQITAAQTNVNITQLSPSCYHTVNYLAPVGRRPQQFAVDIESMNVGAVLRFSMRLPDDAYTGGYTGSLVASVNQTVGYSGDCPQTLGSWSCETDTTCSFIVGSCDMNTYGAGRFYILADAPRGTEIVVERWDPVVPIIQPDVVYYGSINGPSNDVEFDLPFTPNYQIFRIDIDPHVHHDAHFYEKFYAQVRVYNISQGSVSYFVSSGKSPINLFENCASPALTEFDCSGSFDDECMIELTYDRLLRDARDQPRDIPHTFWITVVGEEQQCELHAIKYQLVVQTNWAITYLPINKTICDTVEYGEYNFHRVQPRSVESPQESILRIRVEDVDVSEAVTVVLNNGWLATRDNTLLHGDSVQFEYSNEDGELVADYFCGYDDLYLSVFGDQADNEQDRVIDYRLTVEKIPVRVKELFDDSVYHADDDDDDACPHEHDFYRFKITPDDKYPPGSFFRVLVDSEFPTEVYVNKGGFAWSNCADSGSGFNIPSITGTTSVNVYDFCTFDNTTYFITVVSEGPYYIYTDVRSDVKALTLGEVHRDELEPGMYQMYTLEICDDWFEADDRLVIEITDADNGDVYGFVRHGANPRDEIEQGPGETFEERNCAIPNRHAAYSRFGEAQSGYDFLLVNSCELKAGQYHILIRAAPRDHSANWRHTTFRLFPYLIDYEIDPRNLYPNTPVYDAVDAHTINRIAPNAIPFAHYYRVHPLHEADGYYEQISHAVVRLSDVTGGLLELRVKCGHLAMAPEAYIGGEIYGLTSASRDDYDYTSYLIDPRMKMQSGRRPFQRQRVMDDLPDTYKNGCTGCADYCATMSYDDLDIYSTDNSVALWIPSCYLVWADLYIAVQPAQQYAWDHPIEYNLQMDQYRDYELLQPNTHVQAAFENDNWDYDFYYSIAAEPESMRWRVVVIDGEGVLVTVRNHRCPRQATWSKQVWCDADYFDRPWMCDIEIPTRAAHPGDNAFFVAVNGKNATYSIAFWRGRENCHAFTGTGRHEGLDFCSGLVPYATWRWENYTHLDNEAHCFFEDLYEHFRVQPCYTGVTPECNATLQAFACYESFKRCDEQGFYVGTCRDECMGVAYECANNFETVDLEHYNCDSARYLDAHAETCTGGRAFNSLDAHKHFLGTEPDVLLFESSPSQQESQSSATRLSGLFMTVLLVLIASLI